MLHSGNLSLVMRQVLVPISAGLAPVSVSVLSSQGQALCTVFSETGKKKDTSLDLIESVKIYAMVLLTNGDPLKPWEVLELDNGVYLCLRRCQLELESYVTLMMVCTQEFPVKLAKMRLDKLGDVVLEGLSGYKV